MRVPRRFEAIVFVTHPRRTFRRCHATVCRDAFAIMINNRATPVLARDRASLRSVAELLGHRGLRMVMRHAHLSPAYLSAEVGLLDPTAAPPPAAVPTARTERAKKGQRAAKPDQRPAKVVEFPLEELAPQAGFEPATLRLTEAAL